MPLKQEKGMPPGQSKKGRGRDTDSEADSHVGSYDTLRDEGEHFVHVAQHKKAIESFTKALEFKEGDKNCLVSRSRCWLQLGNARNALEDAEAALEQDKEFIKAIYLKAESMYQLGDFETALVFFHRGQTLRKELQEFRLGIQKAQDAINNSIGSPESVKLETKGDLSFFYKQDEKLKKKGYSKPSQKREEKQERTRPKDNTDPKTIQQLLGELYGDKQYLEKLLQDESLTNRNTQTSKEIKDLILDGLEYLDTRTEFWRQQKPLYARKRDQRLREQGARGGQIDPSRYIMKNLNDIDQAQSDGKYKESLQKSQKTLKTVESWSVNEVPNKPSVIANLYSCMGNASLELGNYQDALTYHEKDQSIAREHDIEEARSRALDNLGRVYARMGKYERAIEIWEEKLPLSKSALEKTWLYHEIGRCHLEVGKNEDARDYGEKSLAAAREADDNVWQLNASVLIAQSEVKLGEYQSAADSFERSLDMAKALSDRGAEDAIKKALDDVNDRIVKGIKDGDDDDKHSVKSHSSHGSQHNEPTEQKQRSPTPEKRRSPTPEQHRSPTPEQHRSQRKQSDTQEQQTRDPTPPPQEKRDPTPPLQEKRDPTPPLQEKREPTPPPKQKTPTPEPPKDRTPTPETLQEQQQATTDDDIPDQSQQQEKDDATDDADKKPSAASEDKD